ncbi:hypothetical protein L1887_53010 [Cichorium endivia]|nr:hypothetical protein L1887_53010 [Cichorium endivia]
MHCTATPLQLQLQLQCEASQSGKAPRGGRKSDSDSNSLEPLWPLWHGSAAVPGRMSRGKPDSVCASTPDAAHRAKKKKGKRIEIEIKHRHLNGVGELHRSRATARCNHVATPEPFVQLWSGCPVLRLKLECQKNGRRQALTLSFVPTGSPLAPRWTRRR